MIYNILWSSKSYGGAEIYVRKMQKKFGINYISLESLRKTQWLNLFFLLLQSRNTFIFHDSRASCLSFFRCFMKKDYFVVHGPGKRRIITEILFTFISFFSKQIVYVDPSIFLRLTRKCKLLINSSCFDIKCNYSSYDVIYFGRIEESKGVLKLCEDWAKLSETRNLHIVGGGTQLNYLKSKYPNIKFYGPLNHTELKKIIQNCGFFCNFSPREGRSLALSEAITSHLIPIVVNLPSHEFLETELGLKLINNNYDNQSAILRHYLEMNLKVKKDLHIKMGEYSVSENSVENTWNEFWSHVIEIQN